jgi:hypothetical protein
MNIAVLCGALAKGAATTLTVLKYVPALPGSMCSMSHVTHVAQHALRLWRRGHKGSLVGEGLL